ncbi:hypothetical protein [Thiobaca trueperi]|nr:hypothetical protein [Thiobaca trueperi]
MATPSRPLVRLLNRRFKGIVQGGAIGKVEELLALDLGGVALPLVQFSR